MNIFNSYTSKITFESESESHSVMSSSLRPHGLYTAHGILQARILEWAAFPFSRGSSQPRDQTQVSGIAGWFFAIWAAGEAQNKWKNSYLPSQDCCIKVPVKCLKWYMAYIDKF